MTPETKYKGSIKLSAIGDALGWITEFEKSSQSIQSKFETEKIDRFYSWKKNVGGRFLGFVDNIKSGSYSDDTQLLLAVARSIKTNGKVDHEYFAKTELTNWLYYARGGGRTVKTAAKKVSRKSAKWFTNFYNFKINNESYNYKDAGANGAAMRVSPIALANLGNIEKIKEEIFCNSIITHGHPRAILGAMLYGFALNQIIIYRPEDFNWETYLTQVGIDFRSKFEMSFKNRPEIREWLRLWNKYSKTSFEQLYELTLTEVQNQLRLIYQSIKQEQSVVETLTKLGCIDPLTKGSGTSTVVAGIYFASKFHDTPVQGIIEAVNSLGTDTDSIASFTGGLLGALHGQGIIPDKWRVVQDMDYLDEIAAKLLAISEDRFEEVPFKKNPGVKILNNCKTDDFVPDEPIELIPIGEGMITSVTRQPTLTQGKYNVIMEIQFKNKQSIVFFKLFSKKNTSNDTEPSINSVTDLLDHAAAVLKSETFEILKSFLDRQKKMPKEFLEVLRVLVNEIENR